jgi:predicted dienelactone hydrolase
MKDSLAVSITLIMVILSSVACQAAQPRAGGGNPARLIDQFDSDNDGALSRDEIPQRLEKLHKAFPHIDANNDGKLSAEELNRLSAARGRQSGSPSEPPPNKPTSTTAPSSSVINIGKPGVDYIDPEILNSEPHMTYQDAAGNIWLEKLDPKTGMPVSGSKTRLDSGAANLRVTYNGPEFGIDATGWAVYYSKEDRGELQIWRAQLKNGRVSAKPLLSDGQRRQSILVSKDPKSKSTYLIYLKGDRYSGHYHWMDVNYPARETHIVKIKGVDSPRWIDDTLSFIYAESEGPDAGQLKLHDTLTGKTRTITSDAGSKSFAYAWKAPEFGNEILALAMVDGEAIAVYRDTGKAIWQRISTLTPPSESKYKNFGSPEPVIFNNRSYVSAVLKSEKTATSRFRDSEVWVFGLGDNAESKFSRQVDDGKSPLMRSDPETFTAAGDVYIYYNAYDKANGYQIHMAPISLTGKAIGVSSAAPDLKFAYTSPNEAVSVRRQVLTWHDSKRSRDFRTMAYVPDHNGSKKTFPLVLFSPGMGGTHDENVYLGDYWAKHGYVVLVFDHPGSNRDMFDQQGQAGLRKAMLDRSNVSKRVEDVRFVIDEVRRGVPGQPFITSSVDATRIAMTGHSYGAFTTMALAGLTFEYEGHKNYSMADQRIRAAIAMGPQGREDLFFGIDEHSWDNIDIPVMTMTGTNDKGSRGQDYTWRLDPFNYMPNGNKYSVVIDNAGHNSFYDNDPLISRGKPQRDPRHFGWIQTASLAFLDAYIKDIEFARQWLKSSAPTSFTGGEMVIDRK